MRGVGAAQKTVVLIPEIILLTSATLERSLGDSPSPSPRKQGGGARCRRGALQPTWITLSRRTREHYGFP